MQHYCFLFPHTKFKALFYFETHTTNFIYKFILFPHRAHSRTTRDDIVCTVLLKVHFKYLGNFSCLVSDKDLFISLISVVLRSLCSARISSGVVPSFFPSLSSSSVVYGNSIPKTRKVKVVTVKFWHNKFGVVCCMSVGGTRPRKREIFDDFFVTLAPRWQSVWTKQSFYPNNNINISHICVSSWHFTERYTWKVQRCTKIFYV